MECYKILQYYGGALFGDLTADCVRDGSFASVRELVASIEVGLAERNLTPKPYRSRADGAEILRKIQRAQVVQSEGNGQIIT